MKTKSKLIGAMAFVLTFVAGYVLGLFINFPTIDFNQTAGTIGRVNNYRNAKATEQDIALKENLLKDEKQQTAMTRYLKYQYAQSLAYAQTTAFVLEQAAAVPGFAEQCDKLDAMKEYQQFLENSRKILLMASLHCQAAESADPSALRNSVNQSFNLIARMEQYQSMNLSFMDQLEAFLLKNSVKAYTGLSQAYDRMMFDQLSRLLVSKDKALASYLGKKHLYGTAQAHQHPDIKGALLVDLKTLDASFPRDMEKLGFLDKEVLGLWDAEQLGGYVYITDAERLNACFDAEQLGIILDAEQLGGLFIPIPLLDTEKLGATYSDVEQLGSVFTLDAEQLGFISNIINDAEQLGYYFADNEKLGVISIE